MSDHEDRIAYLEAQRKSSSDRHEAQRDAIDALRELEQQHHDDATLARGEMRERMDRVELKVDELLKTPGGSDVVTVEWMITR